MSFQQLEPEEQLLLDVCQNALICLYLQVADNRGFTPVPARNVILKKYIKPKIKLPAFKTIKRQLKLLVADEKVKLESQLDALITRLSQTCNNHDIVFEYLGDLHVATGLMVSVVQKDTVAAPGNIYVLGEDLVGSMSGQELSGSIDLYVYCSTSCSIDKLLAAANTPVFSAVIVEQHKDHAHVQVTFRKK